MESRYVIGVDGGGTATRAVLLDEAGRELGRGDAGPSLTDRATGPVEIEALALAAERAGQQADVALPVLALCAGLAGVGREAERSDVEAALAARGIASRARVVTDAEAALYDAFADRPGILVISGTGSIAWGRAEDGREARAGGWGSLIGDEGSGYDIGLRGLRAALRAADGRGSETELSARFAARLGTAGPDDLQSWAARAAKSEIAGLAPLVCEAAGSGDAVAASIVGGAIAALTSHIAALLTRLGPWSALPALALGGGLLSPAGALRDQLVAATADYPCVPLPAAVDAARGAALMAVRELLEKG
ncbi:MAG: BadF/BadG/BcrA/BcrD ATPase family protein [Gemmatimonadales bacterium]|jgi:glucosamine kinase